MSWQLFKKIIDEIADTDKNTRVWMVFFGEALLLNKKTPTIFDLISYAKKKGLTDVVLNSNGNLLDDKTARNLIASGLNALYIGLDAVRPDTYSRIRIGGDYSKVVDNIVNLIEIKKEIHSKCPEIFVQFVEMEENRDEKEEFIKFWADKGVTIKIRPMVSWAGLIDAPNLVLNNAERWPCHWIMQTMSITDTGNVATCAADLDARFVAGDVHKSSIKEIWNGKLKEFRQSNIAKRWHDLPPHCANCKDWQSARADYYQTGV